jgi:nitrogen fixation protein NifQ
MSGYTDTIRKWAIDNRRAGTLPDADGTGEVGLDAGEAGRRLAVRFTLKVDLDRVTDIRYQVFGCGYSMAACAVAADLSVGYTLDEVESIDRTKLDTELDGLPSDRSYCADLAVEALQAAIKSVRSDRQPIRNSVEGEAEHAPRITPDDPVYALLINSPKPERVNNADRHLFASLIAVATQEPHETAAALGLVDSDLASILKTYFLGIDLAALQPHQTSAEQAPPECSKDVLSILLSHLPLAPGHRDLYASVWLAHILAARAAHPGHLWVAMGLSERPQLSAAIRRHLPSLAEANQQNMRWKRYLYKQVCDRNGGTMCKAPNCGVCSDYSLCFAE